MSGTLSGKDADGIPGPHDGGSFFRYFKSSNKNIQTTLYFSLFLCVFPIVAFLGYLWDRTIIVSIPLVLMFCCGLLSFRAAKAIENLGRNK